MTERIVIKHKGILRNLFTPHGTARLVGGSNANDGLILEEHISPPTELPEIQFLTHMIAVGKVTEPCRVFCKEGGLEKDCLLVPGGVFLSTATLQKGIRWEGIFHSSVMSIGIPMMELAMPEPFSQRPVELIMVRGGARDVVLGHLVGALEEVFGRDSSPQQLVVESLCNATAVYLAQRYGVFPLKISQYRSGLTPDRLSRVLDYIEEYLEYDLSVMDLAGVACLSPYHFGKMFKRSTEQSVHQYVIARRVERAKTLLTSQARPLVEIALAVGFGDQSQFTSAFRHQTGTTPGAYARIKRGLKRVSEA
ncbi:helix-turn-helix domain-containing protein [Terracidiphilus gabretensis]|uniref:helix-turn-helix domain-containing protein n=1 Tax=Terracidiphilus gabretensis TaxID=1577687 RepID=UPI00071B6636|nr:AraC family transcriptional regulator [Terracidiphilus gabretensis]